MRWKFRRCVTSVVLFLVTLGPGVVADDWPGWRGPSANNHSNSSYPPVRWSAEENVAWKVPVAGRGHASPCIVGERIFLTSADETQPSQFLLCFDRTSGDLLWLTQLHNIELPSIHANNSHASATPACDGESVFVPMVCGDQLWVSCVSVDGAIRWQDKIGAYRHANGYGTSPVLFRDTVIVASDNQEEPTIVALARSDGHVVWRIKRPQSDNSATPVIAKVAGRSQLLINGAAAVNSYDPTTGRELWHVSHGCEVVANTMAFDDIRVYASGNVPEKLLLAMRADGEGDVTGSHALWKLNRSIPYVPSPLVIDDRLVTVLDNGTVICRRTKTGEELWKHRLGGNFFSSPVLAGGHVYAVSEAGTMYVFEAGDTFRSVAENDMVETCMATPAICNDEVYVRTLNHLVCIRNAAKTQ